MNTAYNDEDGSLTNLAYFLYVELDGAVKNQIRMDKKTLRYSYKNWQSIQIRQK